MTKEYIDIHDNITVKQALDHIFKIELKKAETIYTSYVVDGEFKLIGTVSLRQLFTSDPAAKISDVMLAKPPALNIEDELKEVATMFSKYNYYAAPVVDDEGVLKGIITVDDVIAVLTEEEWGRRS